MKIIFLDIDGVLNCATTTERLDDRSNIIGIERAKVAIFNRIIRETGAKVVLSSSWRHDHDWKEHMDKAGLECEFVGETPILGEIRGLEIKAWLDYQASGKEEVKLPLALIPKIKEPVEKYAILDDDSDMLPDQPHFHTRWKTGLTEEIADEVIKFLND